MPLSRRSLLAALASLPALPAAAQNAGPFSSVAVDVSYLRSLGAGPGADLVQAVMTQELRRLFADRIGGRGPRLVVRVTGLHVTAFPGRVGGFGASSDSIEGEALVVGPRGEILARYPQLAALPAAGSVTDPASEPRRVAAVARVYAQWLRRKIS
jgi:hypothetical protein